MLHNILLSAGLYNEVNKQGKFINVVLAAGEIEARIRLLDETVMQTKLISGMSFPIPKGFKSVAFLSETTQQTKVWLGDLPLTYSPIDAKAVGSSALYSELVSVGYGEPQEILSARIGRSKIVMNAPRDWYVGGAAMSEKSAIKVPANFNFELSTQGAVFGYSADSKDKVRYVADLTPPVTFNQSIELQGVKSLIRFSEKSQRYYCVFDNKLLTMNKDDYSTVHITDVNNASCAYLSDNRLIFSKSMSSTRGDLKIVNEETWQVETKASFLPESVLAVASDEVTGNLAVLGGNSYKLYLGDLSGVSVSPAVFVQNPKEIRYYRGRLHIFTSDYHYFSDDFGATFTEGHVGYGYGGIAGSEQLFFDDATGYIYVSNRTRSAVMHSKDNGVSWSIFTEVYGSASFNVSSIYAAGDYVVAVSPYEVVYTSDGGATFSKYNLDGMEPIWPSGSVNSMYLAKDGYIYMGHNEKLELWRGTGELKKVGGLEISVLSEVN